MNKRLRKKRHSGEFAVFGFHVEFVTKERLAWSLDGDLDGPGSRLSEDLDEWAHARGWCAAPGGDGRRWGCFITPERCNMPNPGLSEKERDAIVAHIRALAEVAQVVAGPLVDAFGHSAAEWRTFCEEADAAFGPRGPVVGDLR